MEHHCIYEERWGKLETKLEVWLDLVSKHVNEGDKVGGYRDRLLGIEGNMKSLKEEISVIKQGYWKVGLACGFLGALLGKLTPDAVEILARWINSCI